MPERDLSPRTRSLLGRAITYQVLPRSHILVYPIPARRQLALGRSVLARCRDIGDSSQFTGSFRPGDPRLIFGLYGPGN